MESEEEMLDAYDSEDDYYGGMQTDEEDDIPVTEENIGGSHRQKQNYIVLSEKQIKERQEEAIKSVVSILSISEEEASILLRRFNWCVHSVQEAWFADEQVVRKQVGLIVDQTKPGRSSKRGSIECRICFETKGAHFMRAPACGHFFCKECWENYIHVAIMDGAGCLSLRCPEPSCRAAVGDEFAMSLVTEEDCMKYERFLVRSFIEVSKRAKWCPGPDCEYAVENHDNDSYDVVCACGHPFCWNCLEDAHRPVDCETVHKWVVKNSSESENMNWVLANSKPCPKCKRSIEKNQGCNHMTCYHPCKYEFCWLCLGSWKEHGEKTGGFYSCNRYETAKQSGKLDEEEIRRQNAKNMIERYSHYYERWATNERSRNTALSDLKKLREQDMGKLSYKYSQTDAQLQFLSDAYMQIVECRRVLKWTYAYGYYFPDNEEVKRQFFEYLQGEAEHALERLHGLAEKLPRYYPDAAEEPEVSFDEYRAQLTGLTKVTKTYFENLVRALENGLADVNGPRNVVKMK